MKIDRSYDWIVVGEHPAALLSACLAARLNLKVLAVPFFKRTSGFLASNRQYIDLESNRILSIKNSTSVQESSDSSVSPLLEKIWKELLQVSILPPTEFLGNREIQLETPNTRELLQKVPAQRMWVQEWMNNLTIRTSAEEEQLKNENKRKPKKESTLVKSNLLNEIDSLGNDLFRKAYFTTFSNITDSLNLETQTQLNEVSQDWVSFRGGRSAYQRLLKQIAKKSGVNFIEDAEFRRVFTKGNRIQGIQLAGVAEMIETRGMGIGVPIELIRESINDEMKIAPIAKEWTFTLALTVNEVGVPPGISNTYIWKEPESPSLEIEWAYPKDYGMRETGIRYFFLRTQIPFTADSLTPEFQRIVAARMYKKFCELFPFVDNHIVKMFPDFRDNLGHFSEAYGYAATEMIPEFLRIYEEKGCGVESGVEGVFVTTSEAYPELGDFGGTRSAVEAVTWLAHQFGLSGALH